MEIKQIAAALVKAQKEFGPALKSSLNPHFKNRYADLSACVEAVVDALNNNGIMLMQPCHEVENGVTVETLFIHESGETLSAGKLHVPASKQDPQGYGSALTYARRYSLMSACGIAPEDDDGQAASQPQRQQASKQPAQAAKLDAQQIAEITNLINETNSDFTAFMEWVSKGVGFNCKALKDVPSDAYATLTTQLKKKLSPK